MDMRRRALNAIAALVELDKGSCWPRSPFLTHTGRYCASRDGLTPAVPA
jgi:hypothetical protein